MLYFQLKIRVNELNMYYDTINTTVSMTPEFQLGQEMNGLIADLNIWRH